MPLFVALAACPLPVVLAACLLPVVLAACLLPVVLAVFRRVTARRSECLFLAQEKWAEAMDRR
jgi:hypothetical protein